MVGVSMVAGDPIGGRDDVDSGLEYPFVQVDIRKHSVEGHTVGLRCDNGIDRIRRHHTDRVQAHDLPRVPSGFIWGVAVQTDQFKIGMALDPLNHFAAHIDGGYLEYSYSAFQLA